MIYIEPQGVFLNSTRGETVLQACLREKINLDHSCGGNGTCGTCRIMVVEGLSNLEARTEIESEMAQDRGLPPEERLACQAVIREAIKIRIP